MTDTSVKQVRRPTEHRSVVQGWMGMIPFRMQAVVLCALRGCDGMPREDSSKQLVRQLRSAVLHPAFTYEDNVKTGNTFMLRMEDSVFNELRRQFFSDVDKYPIHFFMHLLHAAEILGRHHSDFTEQERWWNFYLQGCHSLHLNPESEMQQEHRLGPGSNG